MKIRVYKFDISRVTGCLLKNIINDGSGRAFTGAMNSFGDKISVLRVEMKWFFFLYIYYFVFVYFKCGFVVKMNCFTRVVNRFVCFNGFFFVIYLLLKGNKLKAFKKTLFLFCKTISLKNISFFIHEGIWKFKVANYRICR